MEPVTERAISPCKRGLKTGPDGSLSRWY